MIRHARKHRLISLPREKGKQRQFRLVMHQRPIQYALNGGWRDITFKVKPHQNVFQDLHFAFDELMIGGFPVVLNRRIPIYGVINNGHRFSVIAAGVQRSQARLQNDWLIYPEAWPNVDMRLKNAGHRIPVEMLLKTGHPSRFIFRASINLEGRLDRFGRIRIGQFVIPPPVLKFPQTGVVDPADLKEDVVLDWQVRGHEFLVDLPPGDWAGWVLDPTYTTQPDAAAGVDTHLRQESPTTNFGASTTLWIRRSTSGANRDSLIRFDLSPVPAGSVIDSFELDLYRNNNLGSMATGFYGLVAGNDGWTEAGATWNTIDGVNPWVGGTGPGDNIGVDTFATAWYQAATSGWPASPAHVLLDDVVNYVGDTASLTEFQGMFDDYHGFIFRGDFRAAGAVQNHQFDSSDSATAGQRPKLTIDYTPPASERLAFYVFNIWDPRARILDRKGAVVLPNELRADRYMDVQGMDLPGAKVYDTFVEDPGKTRIVQVEAGAERTRIVPNPNEFADVILKRAGAGI